MQSHLTESEQLQHLQNCAFTYFQHETNPLNGLVLDKTAPDWPASIAATGLALASYPIAVERGMMSRASAIALTLTTLRFFWNSPQGPEPDATGYHGFYYHFLDMRTGRRAWQCELSTVDSAFLIAGMLAAAAYFSDDTPEQQEIRTLANDLYRRVDWQWAQAGGQTISHGWRPESGFLPFRWQGYDEALLLYVLGTRLADPSAAGRKLPGLGIDLRMEALLRHRLSVFGAVVHSSAVARVDRFPRHPGCLHA